MEEALSTSRWLYVALFLIVALVITVYEVIKEAIFKGALTPWQSHTITILVTSFLATFAAVSIRSWSENVLKKEQILKLQQQNIKLQQQNIHTFNLTLKAVHHIVNDFLIHYRFIMRDVKEDGSIRKEAVEILDSSIQEVVQQLKILEELKEPDKEESYKGIYPE
jgi:hypothetical protein